MQLYQQKEDKPYYRFKPEMLHKHIQL